MNAAEEAMLNHLNDEAKKAGLVVRFWANGVLVICSPEHAPEAKEQAPDLPLDDAEG